uniref:Uncharacterized protein n=1 Tax=Oryza punctata TaxID=4537 RepID=A0A0E0K1Q9_ORYPU
MYRRYRLLCATLWNGLTWRLIPAMRRCFRSWRGRGRRRGRSGRWQGSLRRRKSVRRSRRGSWLGHSVPRRLVRRPRAREISLMHPVVLLELLDNFKFHKACITTVLKYQAGNILILIVLFSVMSWPTMCHGV